MRVSPYRQNRRKVILGLASLGVVGATCRYWPEDGFKNPCPSELMPQKLLDNELVRSAWEGVDATQFWDCHTHLIGTGDSGSGLWVNPQMQSLKHPIQWLQRAFYMNASCITDEMGSDLQFVERLGWLVNQMPTGVKLLLLAFDYFHDESGDRRVQESAFYTPNDYAMNLAEQHPDRFEWIASIHPYRPDAVMALRRAVKNGARAVKWLPPAQGMDPASPLCDPFYKVAAELDVPLLVHAGTELAVHGGNTEDFGNPLRLRRPLEHGVRIMVAHCASLGKGRDLDIGPDGPKEPSFALFARMMNETRYDGLLFGEISAITQVNRFGNVLETLLRREEWHPRLLNGSDYPLPGILPLFSLQQLVHYGFIREEQANVLSEIRNFNPLLFDFVLKRSLRLGGHAFSADMFQTRRFFDRMT